MWMPVALAFLAGCTQSALQVEAWYASVDVTEFVQTDGEEGDSDYYELGMLSWEPRGSFEIEIAGGGKAKVGRKSSKALLFGGVRIRKYNGVLKLHDRGTYLPLVTDEEKGWVDLIEQTDVEVFFRAVAEEKGVRATGTMGFKFIDAPSYDYDDSAGTGTASMESGFLATFGGALDVVISFAKTGVSLRLGVEGVQIGYKHRTWNYINSPDASAYVDDYRFSTEASGIFISTMLQF